MSNYSLGIDIGGTGIKIGLVDSHGKILKKDKIKTGAERPSDEVIADLGGLLKKFIAESGVNDRDILGVGVGCPGAISSATGVVDYSCNLNWHNVHLGEELATYVNKPIKISNDANVAALGEAIFGIGRTYRDTILLTLGTGIGGGVIIDKKLYEGNESKGGELGHMVIVVDGEPCSCSRHGCFEAYCSATALIRDTKRAMALDKKSAMWEFVGGDVNNVDGRTAFECSKTGDKSAISVVDRYVKFLGEGMLNFANIFRPQAIMLGGGVCNQGDYLINKLRTYCKERHWGYDGMPAFDILVAELGNDAGIIGAAALIFSELENR